MAINKSQKRAKLVEDATAKTQMQVEKKGPGGFSITVPVPGDRQQKVRVNFETSDFEHAPMVVVETTCGKSGRDGYQWALQENRRMALGAIALDMIEGEEHFVLAENILENEVTPKKLFRAITYVARMGDKVEYKLTGKDVF